MHISKFVQQKSFFKVSNTNINKQLGLEEPIQILRKETIKFMHKIIFTSQHERLSNLIKRPRYRDEIGVSLCYYPRTDKFTRNLINTGYKYYNLVPADIRALPPAKFKIKLKKVYVDKIS